MIKKIARLPLIYKMEIFLFLGVTILYFFLRLKNLTILPIFADEAIYIRWSQVMKAESTLRFLPLSDGKQPLFMWLLMPVFSFFNDPLFAGRFLSVMAGFGTLLGIFLLSLGLFRSRVVALLSCLIYALVPFAVFFDRMALVDSLLTMFGVWILFLGVLLVRYQRIDLAMVTGLVLGGALLTKSPAMFFAFLLPVAAILLPTKSRRNLLASLLKLVGLWLIVYIFAFGAYNILRLGPNFHMIAARNLDYVFSFREILAHPLDPFRPHIGQVWEWFLVFLGWPLIIAFFGGIIFGARKWPRQTILLLSWFFLPLLAQMAIAKVFTARYIFFMIPFLLIFGAIFLNQLIGRITKLRFTAKGQIVVAIVVLVLFLLPSFRFDCLLFTDPQKLPLPEGERTGYLEQWTSGYGINEVRDYLKQVSQKQHVNVGTEGYFGTLPDGLQIYFDKDPKVTVFGVGLALSLVPESLKESAASGEALTYLVVNESRMGAKNDPSLELILKIPKAKGEKGQDSLLLYQVK